MKNFTAFFKDKKDLLFSSSFVMSQTIISLLLGLITTSIIARYYGPNEYGLFNYALSISIIFSSVSSLGLDSFTLKSFIDSPLDTRIIVRSTVIIKLISSTVANIIMIIFSILIESNNIVFISIILVLSLTNTLKAFDALEIWMQSIKKYKSISVIKIVGIVSTSLLKLLCVMLNLPIVFLSMVYVFDILFVMLLILYIYQKSKSVYFPSKFSLDYSKSVLAKSWFIALSGILSTLYMRIDQVMIGKMLIDKSEVGIYSAAVKIAELWYFIPTALILVYKSKIFELKKSSHKKYINALSELFDYVIILGVLFSVTMLLIGENVILLIYGDQFIKSYDVLIVNAWAGIFAFLGSVRSVWLISENLQKYSVIYTLSGLVLNVILNLIFIPAFGIIGAAYATLFSQIWTALILIIFNKTRPIELLMLKSLIGIGLLSLMRKVKKNELIGEEIQ